MTILAIEPAVAYHAGMAHRAPALEKDEPLAVAVARARATYARGEGVDHRVVSIWLKTWETPVRRPFADWLATWNG